MYFGRIVELGSRDAVFSGALHPYTHLLLNSAPAPGRKAVSGGDREAELPDPYNPPKGCAFFARCPNGTGDCQAHVPSIDEARTGPATSLLFSSDDVKDSMRKPSLESRQAFAPPFAEKKRKRPDIIADMLRERMIEAGLQPGDRVPAEWLDPEKLHASRGTVREALKI